jgi:peptidyl-tRNA hydrolase, PTH1 family
LIGPLMGLGKFLYERLGRRQARSDVPVEKRQVRLIVGLGNPGTEHAGTRHNVGFEVVDLLARFLGAEVKKKKFGALVGEVEHRDKKLILIKPQEFMNRSGQAVATTAGFYKLDPTDILVITDDMALEPGKIRVRASGSAGGHNGLADIVEKMGTTELARLRVGIGKAPGPGWRDWVLTRPSPKDRVLLDGAVLKARDAALCWIEKGVTAAMNGFNAGDDAAKQ